MTIEEMKTEFFNLVWGLDRKGKQSLLEWLDESNFYKAPASTRYHLAEAGGLLEHSLNVCNLALDINHSLGSPVDRDTIILVSLFHDLGKHNAFNKDYYAEKPLLKSGLPPAQPYEKNKNLVPIPHEVLSIQILNKFIELTEDETWAILHHNGMYGDLKYSLQGKETKLQMILHFADMWASRVVE